MSPALLPLLALAHAGPKAVMEELGTIEARQLRVHLELDPAETAYSGTSTVVFEHSKPIEEVVLHAAEGMEIAEVAFVRGTRRWPATFARLEDEQIVTVEDYFEPALREHLGAFVPEETRNFFWIAAHYDPTPLYTHFWQRFELARMD